jgi:hypothetical protein
MSAASIGAAITKLGNATMTEARSIFMLVNVLVYDVDY